MEKIKYKILAEDYHEDFNTFEMEKNKTYYLLGKNGIGKSTLMRFFKEQKNDFYDIEFKINIKKDSLKDYFSKTQINPDELEEIISDWKEINKTVKYSELYTEENSLDFEEIADRVLNKIVIRKRDEMIAITSDIKKMLHDIIESLSQDLDKIKSKLDSKITLRELSLNSSDVRSIKRKEVLYSDAINKTNEQEKIIAEYLSNLKSKAKVETPPIQDLNLDLRYEGFYTKNKLFSKIVNKFNDLNRVIYRNDINMKYSLNDIVRSLMFNLSDYKDINQHMYFDEKKYSTGAWVLKKLEEIATNYKKNAYRSGLVLDEPFNFLDNQNIKKAKASIDGIKTTKLLSSHSLSAMDATDIPNIIMMFEIDGKRGIANFSELANVEKSGGESEEIVSQINSILLNWMLTAKKDLLLVEGYQDYSILNDKLKDIVVIPIGGSRNAGMAMSYYSTKGNKIKILFDKDSEGKKGSDVVGQIARDSDITKIVFRDSKFKNFEELIANKKWKSIKEKNNMIDEIKKGEHAEKLNEIIAKILKEFK